jgi:hypothetical protein
MEDYQDSPGEKGKRETVEVQVLSAKMVYKVQKVMLDVQVYLG